MCCTVLYISGKLHVRKKAWARSSGGGRPGDRDVIFLSLFVSLYIISDLVLFLCTFFLFLFFVVL